MKRKLVLVAVSLTILTLVVSVAGCGGGNKQSAAGGGKPKVGGTWVQAIPQEPRTLDPAKYQMAVEDTIANYIGAALVAYAPDGKMVPWLAKDYQVSPDGKTLTFHLKDNIKFHSGKKLTAGDYKATFERDLDPKTGSPVARDMLAGVTSIEAPDDLTLILKLDKPNYALLMNLGSAGYLQPVDPTELAKWGDQYGQHPSSVGPYKLKEIKAGEYVTLERNPDYNWAPPFVHQGPWYIQEIKFKVMPENATQVAAFQSGELSMLAVPPQDWSKYADNPNYQFFQTLSGSVSYLQYNFDNPLLKDLKMRQAINYALNKKALIDGVWEGHGQVGYSPIHPGLPGYLKESEQPPLALTYQPDKAKQLLDELGWKDTNNDGIREKNGKPLKFRLYVFAAGTSPMMGEAIQAQLKEVGIATTITSYEVNTAYEYYRKGDYDLGLAGWGWYGGDAADIMNMTMNSSQIGTGLNGSRYRNKAMDDLLTKARQTMDEAEHIRLLGEAQKLAMQDAVYCTIGYPVSGLAVQKKYKGIKLHPMMPTFIMDDCWVEEGK